MASNTVPPVGSPAKTSGAAAVPFQRTVPQAVELFRAWVPGAKRLVEMSSEDIIEALRPKLPNNGKKFEAYLK